MRRKGLIALGIIAVAQIIQPDRSVQPNDPGHDLITVTSPSQDVQDLLRTACYDCHSDHTTYPWYGHVTPVNFWLQSHIDEGRAEFDMSSWGRRRAKWQRHKAEESVELIEAEEMPPPSYARMHGDAQLSAAQRTSLTGFFNGLRQAIPGEVEGGGR